jgi:putative Mn2+ efflux pump MntP
VPMVSPPPTAARKAVVAEMRKLLLRLIAGVVVLDVVAIGLYYGLHVQRSTSRTQAIFAGAWTVLTLVVVLVGLGKIRVARRRR